MSDEDANSSPLFKLGRSPLSVVDVTPILVEDPPEVVFGSFVEEVAVIDALAAVDAALDSVLDEEVASVLLLALAGVATVEAEVEAAAEDVEVVIEDDASLSQHAPSQKDEEDDEQNIEAIIEDDEDDEEEGDVVYETIDERGKAVVNAEEEGDDSEIEFEEEITEEELSNDDEESLQDLDEMDPEALF